MRVLTWDEFDAAVDHLSAMAEGLHLTGVYGIPRGGLPLAVALSHRLALPLLQGPQSGCLLVDDVYETGHTLEPYKGLPALTAVWISKTQPTWWQAAEVVTESKWLVFPWEHLAAAQHDEESYRASRE